MTTYRYGRRYDANRSGSAMILVLVATAIAFILGLTLLAGATTATRVAQTLDNHAQARQIAESGIDMARAYLQQTPEWYYAREPGRWIDSHPVLDGSLSVDAAYDDDITLDTLPISNASFNLAVGQLSNPLLFPPMSGTIGNWHMQRSGVNLTGLTVPTMGIQTSAHATDGVNLAYISFVAGVLATGTISQELDESLQPNTAYALYVDVGKGGLAGVLANTDIRVVVGTTVMVSSQDPTLLQLLDLDNDFQRYILRFTTDESPPAGPVRIELSASSVLGVVTAVAFDQVRLEIETRNPITFTSTGWYGNASHIVTAVVDPLETDAAGRPRIVQWIEP